MFSSLFSLQDVAPILSFSIIDFVWENLHYVSVRSLTAIIFQPDLEGDLQNTTQQICSLSAEISCRWSFC